MVDGRHRASLGTEPGARRQVQLARLSGMAARQLIAKEVREQGVIPVTPAVVVDWGQEHVRTLQLFEQTLAVTSPGHRVAQVGIELVQDAGGQQELPRRRRKSRDDGLE